MAFLEIQNIKKKFGNNEVLKGITFSLDKGEVLAIIGSSGSGKTTLLRCINFLENADAGKIFVGSDLLFDGASNKKEQEKHLRLKRLHFGLVFQSFNLFPQYNVIQNVTLAKNLLEKEELKASLKKKYFKKFEDIFMYFKYKNELISEYKKIKDKNNGIAMELLAKVGLADKKDAYPFQLSGGQQQRVAIARALAMNPDVLCFDEPTSALDPELTGEVLKVIKDLKNTDRTMIIVTHEMDFARDVADKIIYMANGVIEESGTPTEVFGNPKSEKTKQFLGKFTTHNE